MRRIVSRLTLLAPCAAATACAMDSGRGYSKLESVELSVSAPMLLAPASGELTLSAATLDVARLELLGISGGAAEEAHAHGGEGSAAEEPELALSIVASAAVTDSLDLLTGTSTRLSSFEPSAELPRSEIESVELDLTRLAISGSVSSPALSVPLQLDLDLAIDVALSGDYERHIDEGAPERLNLAVSVAVDPALFAEIDLMGYASPLTELSLDDRTRLVGALARSNVLVLER